jgi:hypothetical protein
MPHDRKSVTIFVPPGKRSSALRGACPVQVAGQLVVVRIVIDVMVVRIEGIHLLLLW